METDVREVRLCWPKPDVVCLQGGCAHCDNTDGQWVTVERLRAYSSASEKLWSAFLVGRAAQWPNRSTR